MVPFLEGPETVTGPESQQKSQSLIQRCSFHIFLIWQKFPFMPSPMPVHFFVFRRPEKCSVWGFRETGSRKRVHSVWITATELTLKSWKLYAKQKTVKFNIWNRFSAIPNVFILRAGIRDQGAYSGPREILEFKSLKMRFAAFWGNDAWWNRFHTTVCAEGYLRLYASTPSTGLKTHAEDLLRWPYMKCA